MAPIAKGTVDPRLAYYLKGDRTSRATITEGQTHIKKGVSRETPFRLLLFLWKISP
jgi:hypothetical protein